MDEARLRQARIDPGSVFPSPEALAASEALPREVRVELLRRWAYDAREMLVAQEEAMAPGQETDLLERILGALVRLGAEPDLEHEPPTKHGGV